MKDEFVTASGRKVDLGIYVEHGKERLAAYAMDALKRSMRWDEEVFGREYDLDIFNIVAVSDFNMGAMENKGLNIFNDKYVLADDETATDADFANIEAIIAHEYFHNWTGNRITCRDWFQLCLKEGLTVFRDHEFSADQRSRPVKRIAEVRTLRAHQFPEDQGPLAHPVRPRRYREINNFYTATVYEKGSEVVRMIKTILGAEAFRKGMDLYFERHDGEAATVEDFLKVFEDVSGRDLQQFALWYHQAGTPNLTVSTLHDPGKREFVIEIEQSVPPTPSEARKRLMHIPLAFGLVGADGADIAHGAVEGATVENGVIHVKKRRHVVRFSGIKERPALSLNRGFSAPVTLSVEQRREDQFFLARHDSDPFSRWQAYNTLLTEALIAAFRNGLGGKPPAFPEKLVALAGVIAGGREAGARLPRARAGAARRSRHRPRASARTSIPTSIFASREALAAAIARTNEDAIAQALRRAGIQGPVQPRRGGRRPPRAAQYAARLSRNPARRRRACCQAFRRRHQHDRPGGGAHRADASAFRNSLRQGCAGSVRGALPRRSAGAWTSGCRSRRRRPAPARSTRSRKLTEYPGFTMANPNRVRALIGTFATANQTAFNRADGAGYDFFARAVLEIEKRNPQLAARLATALRSWRSLEPVRQGKAREALLLISGAENLSADLRDIVERTLA